MSVGVAGLPDSVRACLFDMDGVLTDTAVAHRKAWKETFDSVLPALSGGADPFSEDDYLNYVDGRTRSDGVREFLSSRGIHVAEGTSDDAPDELTVEGIGSRKNALFQDVIAERGVHVYPGSFRYLELLRANGVPIGVVTSSANSEIILDAGELTRFMSAIVDGTVIRHDGLAGKPAPDSFLAAARQLDRPAEATAVFEDALSGVQAGRNGKFGYVVGVDRHGQAAQLREYGADRVVTDLADLLERP